MIGVPNLFKVKDCVGSLSNILFEAKSKLRKGATSFSQSSSFILCSSLVEGRSSTSKWPWYNTNNLWCMIENSCKSMDPLLSGNENENGTNVSHNNPTTTQHTKTTLFYLYRLISKFDSIHARHLCQIATLHVVTMLYPCNVCCCVLHLHPMGQIVASIRR